MVALAGSVCSTPALAASAGLAISEASVYGFRSIIRAFNFITQAKRTLEGGQSIAIFEEYANLASPCFLAGIIACYADTREHGEGTFFRLLCTTLRYTGSAPRRKWSDGTGKL